MTQPKFIPKPGQVDYTDIRYAPVVNIVVTFKGMIYCVKRSPDMRLYPNYWDWVCGFLDDNKSIEEKAYEELSEELGLKQSDIESLTRAEPWIDEAPKYKKTWMIVPILAKVKTDKFTLDWEATEGKWFKPEELKELDMVSGSLKTAEPFFPELKSQATPQPQTHQKESYEQLLRIVEKASGYVEVGAHYYHYKDHQHVYTVRKVALREEDNEPCVVYEAEYMPGTTWIRPLSSWLEEVEVAGKTVKRFTRVVEG